MSNVLLVIMFSMNVSALLILIAFIHSYHEKNKELEKERRENIWEKESAKDTRISYERFAKEAEKSRENYLKYKSSYEEALDTLILKFPVLAKAVKK